jgi:uncharacterized protein (DUF1810 family)
MKPGTHLSCPTPNGISHVNHRDPNGYHSCQTLRKRDNTMMQTDPYDLKRFEMAQRGTYERALEELRRGCKTGHWMWFIFPQLDGLGSSPTARFYAIRNIEEAKAYLGHSVLGERLEECTDVIARLCGRSATEIFGYPDDVKLRSSMTLFEQVSDSGSVFSEVLGKYFAGNPDARTLELLGVETT